MRRGTELMRANCFKKVLRFKPLSGLSISLFSLLNELSVVADFADFALLQQMKAASFA
jgi:hypothetical protein